MSTLRCVLLMYDELLHTTKLPSLRMRWLQAIAVIMYKVEDGLVTPLHYRIIYCYQLAILSFEILISPYPDFGLLLNNYGKHSLTHLGPVIWSKLELFSKSFESLDIFKKHIEMVYFTTLLENACKDCFFLHVTSKK